jgi:hypothetical protein
MLQLSSVYGRPAPGSATAGVLEGAGGCGRGGTAAYDEIGAQHHQARHRGHG